MYCLTVLEAESLNSRLWKSCVPLDTWRGNILPCLFLAFGGPQRSLALLGLQVHHSSPPFSHGVCSLCLSSHVFPLRMSLCVQISPFYRDISHFGAHLNDLILT